MSNIIQMQLGSEELWPGQGFSVNVHCDLELRDTLHPRVMDNNFVKYYPDPTWQ